MSWNHPHARRDRARIAGGVIAVAFVLLAAAFFRVQVLSSTDYALTAENNRLRQIELPAPRGTLYDRNGRVVADNVPGWAVTILPDPQDTIAATLHRLAPILELSDARVAALEAEITSGRHLTVDVDVPFERISVLEERRPEFPGVYIETRPTRRYFGGAAVGHIVGHLGEISAGQLADSVFPGYEQGMIIGQTGLELQYEEVLQGVAGYRRVEVDVRGRIVGDFEGLRGLAAGRGEDLHLSIDLGLQQFIHEIFPDSMTGAVVAIDPADGSVLALYSAPSFDPNLFVGGIDREVYTALMSDAGKPFSNRAIQGAFAPASTWKLVTAAMAMDMGLIEADTRMPQPCEGSIFFGRLWRCHKADGHGDVDLIGALAGSCNVYFYQLGIEMGLEPYLERANELGLGDPCGIDLPNEIGGTFPSGPEYWEETFNETPQAGETLNLAIGQGPISMTPLKMAQFYTAIARDGSAPVPLLVPERADPEAGEAWRIDVGPDALQALRDGMRAVTAPGGTAYLSSLELWDLIGKTGSGQNPRGLTDGWFAGMAGPKGGDPEIVIVALVEDLPLGGGSTSAAPIAAKAVDYYLRSKRGLEVPEVQTLREHILTGPWPEWAPRPPSN
jgi:penicillin-binding protein 2